MRKKGQKVSDVEYDANNADKFKDENMYKYHENTQEFDPHTQPFSYFYVTIGGSIDFGEFFELDGLAIRYNFVSGADWNLAGGEKTGAGQHSFKGVSVKGSSQRVVWNLPFEVTFRSMTPFGWPQLVLYCTAKDSDGVEFVRAYGCTHMPLEPGTHTK